MHRVNEVDGSDVMFVEEVTISARWKSTRLGTEKSMSGRKSSKRKGGVSTGKMVKFLCEGDV